MRIARGRTALLLAFLLAVGLVGSAFGREDPATVTRVIDGDTIEVRIHGKTEKVRLIGVDTPETVDPRRPVEYFGKEAAAFTKRLVNRKHVILVDDPENQNRDGYGRLLRYVFLSDETLVNAEIIRLGYGHAYTRYPFSLMQEFRKLQHEAREAGRGLWAEERGD